MRSTAPRVPYLTAQAIEDRAGQVLRDYQAEYGRIWMPPVPIDAIVELHLKLTFSFMDLCEMYGTEGIHGALWVDRREVGIDQSLDPELHPELEGRYHFTLAHEVGHWTLHRDYVASARREPEGYVCHKARRRNRIEWQADYFAACLLMPRRLVFQSWDYSLGSGPMDVQAMREATSVSDPEDGAESLREYLENLCRPMASEFCVSPIAMRIRLEEMGLFVHPKLQAIT